VIASVVDRQALPLAYSTRVSFAVDR
jgi:hypothetical protein